MKTELFVDRDCLSIMRYLRRINARLIRMVPRKSTDGREAWLVMYIGG